jgi:hypothetical protein
MLAIGSFNAPAQRIDPSHQLPVVFKKHG